MSRFTLADLAAAASPVGVPAGLTLADCNVVVQIIGGCVGTAFLIWKWRRAARRPAAPDFEA